MAPISKQHIPPPPTSPPSSQNICISLLTHGHIQSFISFFNNKSLPADTETYHHLLVQLESSQSKSKIAADAEEALKQEEAEDKKDDNEVYESSIADIEIQTPRTPAMDSRSNDLYASYRNLAIFFRSEGNGAMALDYFRKGLEVVQNSDRESKGEEQGEAWRDLGHELLESGDSHSSLNAFETSLTLATKTANLPAELLSKKALVTVHTALASSFESSGDFNSSIPHHLKCLEYDPLDSNIHYRLGKAYQETNDIPNAILTLHHFLTSAKNTGNKNKEGMAQCALAACYEMIAAEYLEEFIVGAAKDASQVTSAAMACNQLGALYNRMEKFELAVHYFEQHFKIKERKLEVAEILEVEGVKPSTAQVQLAISRANARAALFFECVANKQGMDALLKWKSERTFGDYVPIGQAHSVPVIAVE